MYTTSMISRVYHRIPLGPVLIMIAAVLWAMDGVLRRSLYSLPPLTIVLLEHAIGSIILLPIMWRFRQQLSQLSKNQWLHLSGIGLLSGLLGTLWFTSALVQVNYISLSVVFLLQKLQPLFAILAAAIFLRERITRSYLLWAAVALIAAYFVTFPSGVVNLQTGSGTLLAAVYALMAAAAWGSSTVLSKIALQSIPAPLTTSLRFAITTVFAGLAVVIFGDPGSISSVEPTQWLRFFLIACSTGMVALYLYYIGLARTEAKVSTILELVFPVVAVGIDAVMLKSFLSPVQIVAALVLLFAASRLAIAKASHITFISKSIHGKGRGKKIGIPTINLTIPSDFSLHPGVYAAFVTLKGTRYPAALHYGAVPTFAQSKPSLEAHLLTNLGLTEAAVRSATIRVEIIQRIRGIKKFASQQQLVDQIAIDVSRINTILAAHQ